LLDIIAPFQHGGTDAGSPGPDAQNNPAGPLPTMFTGFLVPHGLVDGLSHQEKVLRRKTPYLPVNEESRVPRRWMSGLIRILNICSFTPAA
jgi:hypothetical protein